MSTISQAADEVSIFGTGIAHVPLTGKPEFAGLLRDTAGKATAQVRDGALHINCDDVTVAIAWRDAWQAAVAQLELSERKADA